MQPQYRLLPRKALPSAENIKVGIERDQRTIGHMQMNGSGDGRERLARLWEYLAVPTVSVRLGCRGTRLRDATTRL